VTTARPPHPPATVVPPIEHSGDNGSPPYPPVTVVPPTSIRRQVFLVLTLQRTVVHRQAFRDNGLPSSPSSDSGTTDKHSGDNGSPSSPSSDSGTTNKHSGDNGSPSSPSSDSGTTNEHSGDNGFSFSPSSDNAPPRAIQRQRPTESPPPRACRTHHARRAHHTSRISRTIRNFALLALLALLAAVYLANHHASFRYHQPRNLTMLVGVYYNCSHLGLFFTVLIFF